MLLCVVVVVLPMLLDRGASERCKGAPPEADGSPQTRIISCFPLMNSRFIRPVSTASPVHVNFTLEQLRVVDLNDKTNLAQIELYLKFQWHDDGVKWRSEDYEGVEEVVVTDRAVWVPFFGKYKGTDRHSVMKRIFKVRVFYNGTVQWIVRHKKTFGCYLDLTDFPYDRQNCTMEFSLSSYSKDMANFHFLPSKQQDVKFLDSEWRLVDSYFGMIEGMDYQSEAQGASSLWQGNIIIDRNPSFYNPFILAPCLLIPLLTLTLFWIPIQSMQRFTLCTFLFMCILCPPFLMRQLPNGTNQVPLIVRYCLFDLLLLAICFFVILFSHNLFHRHHPSQVPDLVKTIFFNRVFLLFTSSSLPSCHERYDPNRKTLNNKNKNYNNNNNNNNSGGGDDELGGVLKQLSGYLGEQVTQQIGSDEYYDRNEWRQLAYIIERLTYFLLLTCFVIVTAAIFASKYVPRRHKVFFFESND